MIRLNNEKRQLLTDENRTYYERILLYVRAASFKEERLKEERLLKLLEEIIVIQETGETAANAFGQQPKELAETILSELPREPLNYILTFSVEIALTMIAVFTFVYGVLSIISNERTPIYLGNTILSVVLLWGTLMTLMVVVFTTLQREAFVEKKSIRFTLLIAVIGIVGVGLLIVVNKWVAPFGGELQLGKYGMVSIACLLFLITFIMTKIREQR